MPALDTEYVLRVLLVFVRTSGLLLAAPFFGQRSIPVKVRVLLGVLLAYSFAGLADGRLPTYVEQDAGVVLALGLEVATGLLIGFAARLIFRAITFAGSIMGYQMALSIAQTYNPMNGTSSNPLGEILSFTFLVAFLLVDGHHFLLRALGHSFEVIPLGGASLSESGPPLLGFLGDFFHLSLRLAAPFIVLLFLTDIALGIFARLIPQANLFTLSLPAKLLVGTFLFMAFTQSLFPSVDLLMAHIESIVMEIIGAITPS